MQSPSVRRWNLAQADYRLGVYICTITLLILSASSISRSFEMVALTVTALVLGLIVFAILVPLSMFTITAPIIALIRNLSGRYYNGFAAYESLCWAGIVAALIYAALNIVLAFKIEAVLKLIGIIDTDLKIEAVMTFTALLVINVLLFFIRDSLLEMIFEQEPSYLAEKRRDENGNVCSVFTPNPKHPKNFDPSKASPELARKEKKSET